MNHIGQCPFCGGRARLTAKDIDAIFNDDGEKRRKYRLRVICNKCRATGKPIKTAFTPLNIWSYINWDAYTETFEEYANEAIEAWNGRSINE